MAQLLPITERPRRLRRTPALRALVQETHLLAEDLVLPLFIIDGSGPSQPVASMPGQNRLTLSDLIKVAEQALLLGIRAVALFPCIEPSLKNTTGAEALSENTLVLRAVRLLKSAIPELCVITDIALDPYTSHGHDGVLTADGRDVDNDATVDILARMAVLNGAAGVDLVAPSDMMDGRIGAIRQALDAASLTHTGILSYSAKYASAYYGPFRDAVGSAKAANTFLLGKDTYQMNPANRREAFRETSLDEAEGADILMVKPAGPYLDIIRELRDRTALPIAAYQVSGEYAQIHAAAKMGWLDLERTRNESLMAIKRAGADLIFTYFALPMAQALRNNGISGLEAADLHEPGSGI